MFYKTILVHVDDTPQSAERIRIAASLAVDQEAHLIGIAITGITQLLWQNAALEYSDPNLAAYFDALRQRAASALTAFLPTVESLGVKSCETLLMDDESTGGFSGRARCSDLCILGQPNSGQRLTVSEDFTEYVLLNSGRPALIVPHTGHFAHTGQRVLIAWDGGVEAARAVSGALPLLKRASMVDIVVFNAVTPTNGNAAPGVHLQSWLQRHGVAADVCQQRTHDDLGHTLLAMAADLSSDLLVMGGYGHSRFREMLLGGATRRVLASMRVPVLMAH